MAAEKRLGEIIPNFRCILGTKLYRSSRPDKLTNGSNISLLGKLGIRTILDLRSEKELSGDTLLDAYYEKISEKQKIESKKSLHQDDDQTLKNKSEQDKEKKYLGKRFNCHLLGSEYKKCIFRRLPILWRFLVAFLHLIDCVFGTVYSFKTIVTRVLNKEGCAQQYVDIVSTSGEKIVEALRLLTDKNNIPALICCAWGKDRTGIFCAFIQELCGVDREIILNDYAMSEQTLDKTGLHKQMIDHMQRFNMHPRYADAKRENMENLFKFTVTSYGSVAEYLMLHGLTKEEIDKIVENIKV